jgi:hypothetical protein
MMESAPFRQVWEQLAPVAYSPRARRIREVEKGLNTIGYDDMLPLWLSEPLAISQTKSMSVIVDLPYPMVNALSADHLDGRVSSSEVTFQMR